MRAFDRSGYVREAAVRELGSAPRPDAIRVLLVRANDWVPEVRAAAAAALLAHLRDDFLPAWATALEAFAALRNAGRVDRSTVLAPIDAFLVAPQRLERLVAVTRAAPVETRRIVAALRRSATTEPAALARLLAEDAASSDIVTALRAARAGAGLGDPALRDEVERAALGSPHAAVRRAAVADALARRHAERGARAVLIARFAFDPSGAVRAHVLGAADAVERRAIADASRWRLDAPPPSALAADDRARAIALHNLIALDEDEAAERCAASLAAAGPSLRAVAFAGAWPRADAARREALLLQAFADPALRVQRWAARAVVRDGLVPAWRELLALVVRSPAPQRALAVRRALGRASPWWRLAFELALGEAAGAYEPRLLAEWCFDADRSYVAPPAGERAELAAAWQRAAPRLDPALARAVGTRLARHGVMAD